MLDCLFLSPKVYEPVIKPHVMRVIHQFHSYLMCCLLQLSLDFQHICRWGKKSLTTAWPSVFPLETVNHSTLVWKEDELTFGWGERPIQISFIITPAPQDLRCCTWKREWQKRQKKKKRLQCNSSKYENQKEIWNYPGGAHSSQSVSSCI